MSNRNILGCTKVKFGCTMWVIEIFWFPKTRDDLRNLIYSGVTLGVWYCLGQAALGVRVLGNVRGSSYSRTGCMSIMARSS